MVNFTPSWCFPLKTFPPALLPVILSWKLAIVTCKKQNQAENSFRKFPTFRYKLGGCLQREDLCLRVCVYAWSNQACTHKPFDIELQYSREALCVNMAKCILFHFLL